MEFYRQKFLGQDGVGRAPGWLAGVARKDAMKFYRQGDVGLVEVSQLPAGARSVKAADGIILAFGEVTGHSHAIGETTKARLWDAGAERFLQVLEKTGLKHEEHAPIDLDPGIYRVVIQREYHPQEYRPQKLRRVQDWIRLVQD